MEEEKIIKTSEEQNSLEKDIRQEPGQEGPGRRKSSRQERKRGFAVNYRKAPETVL